MHFIVTSNGSFGDVFPFVGLAHALRARGHDVTLVSNERYAHLADGLEFVQGGTAAALAGVIEQFDVSMSPAAVGRLMHGLLVEPLPGFYDALAGALRDDSVIVGFPLVTAARVLHDERGVPWVGCHLAPSGFRSVLDAPRPGAGPPLTFLPSFVLRGMFSMVDWMLDRSVAEGTNAFRATRGLEPVRGVFSWMDSPERMLGLFPPWFGPRQDDWGDHRSATDFPLWDAADEEPLSAELEAFLAEGDPPIAFTAGSPAQGVARFHAAAAEACSRLGRRGILLSRYPDDIPPELPPGVLHATYAPFSALLPRLSAFVHHGGIGTCAQALASGVRQLIVPWGMDQFDNSWRVQRQGVARELTFKKVGAKRLARELDALLGDEAVGAACAATAARFDGVQPFAAACEQLEAYASGR